MPDITERLRAAGCVFAEEEAHILHESAAGPQELEAMVARRVAGEPVEHVVGWAQFCERRITVAPGVFVPRRRTEFLVAQALVLAPESAVIVDLCCGSGVIGAVLAYRLPNAEVHAADVDLTAVRCARVNLGDRGQVYQGDLFRPLSATLRGRVHVLTVNVPYVPSDELDLMPVEARRHEPRFALDGGSDGLDLLRRVAGEASAWLTDGGSMLSEVAEHQAATAVSVLASGGLRARSVTDGDSTVVIGTRQSARR